MTTLASSFLIGSSYLEGKEDSNKVSNGSKILQDRTRD